MLLYFTTYVLNMFRTLIYPSSGASDYSAELPHWSCRSSFIVCWSFNVVGFEWCPCCRLKHNCFSHDWCSHIKTFPALDSTESNYTRMIQHIIEMTFSRVLLAQGGSSHTFCHHTMSRKSVIDDTTFSSGIIKKESKTKYPCSFFVYIKSPLDRTPVSLVLAPIAVLFCGANSFSRFYKNVTFIRITADILVGCGVVD